MRGLYNQVPLLARLSELDTIGISVSEIICLFDWVRGFGRWAFGDVCCHSARPLAPTMFRLCLEPSKGKGKEVRIKNFLPFLLES